MTLSESFGRAVSARRSELDLTQEQLAHRTGFGRTYISGVERSSRNPSLKAIQRIAGGLEIDLSALFASAERIQKEQSS